ncbi:MAG: DUF5343 domain-containing protein [Candidatus Sabulitectum sp.]|nr:DUF5343 domain-containing protein [Candidatus Sabulitectum sp.]
MKTYPAVRDPGSIELLFRSIRSKDQPDKITTDYLASIGFRRQPDVKLLELLFFLGFIDNNLAPTDQWRTIKDISDEQFREILSSAIAEAYRKVFQYQTEQESTDSKILMAFFKKETGVSDTESAYMVLTLQVLIDLADFQDAAAKKEGEPAVPAPIKNRVPEPPKATLPDVSDEPAPGMNGFANGVSLNITIPASAMDAELIAMVKELLKKAL